MSEFKGTPGPWAIYHDHPHPETARDMAIIRQVGAPKHEDVTSVFLCDYPGKVGERARANAQLIAAAPELLEALKRCKFDSLNMSLEDLKFCRAAIAKAIGHKPAEVSA